MAAIASGQVTVSGCCAIAGSDAAARVTNVKLKHCESRMTCSHLPDSHVHQSSVSRSLPWTIAHGNGRPATSAREVVRPQYAPSDVVAPPPRLQHVSGSRAWGPTNSDVQRDAGSKPCALNNSTAAGDVSAVKRARAPSTCLAWEPMLAVKTCSSAIPAAASRRARQLNADARDMFDHGGGDLDQALADGRELGTGERVCRRNRSAHPMHQPVHARPNWRKVPWSGRQRHLGRLLPAMRGSPIVWPWPKSK